MEEDGATLFSSLHPDIVETHILTRLDGPTLAVASCASTSLRRLSSQHHLWANLCHSTWPSTATSPRLGHLVSSNPRSFFSLSFPLPPSTTSSPSIPNRSFPSQLISAVDIHYQNNLIFSKLQDTETLSGWFNCSPFRIDLVHSKDDVVRIPRIVVDDTCSMTLSWILIDPTRPRVMNLSSFKAVSAQRHWLSGEVQVRFVTILGEREEMVQCEIVVALGKCEEGGEEMEVREVSVEMEDMEGMHLKGRDSLVILDRAMEEAAKRGGGGKREEEGRRRHGEFMEKKRKRRERKMRVESVLDMLCVVLGVIGFAAFWLFLLSA